MRDKGLCPCPRCLISKEFIDKMGTKRDRQHRNKLRTFLWWSVQRARYFIYELARPIGGANVNAMLKAVSAVPTIVSLFLLIIESDG